MIGLTVLPFLPGNGDAMPGLPAGERPAGGSHLRLADSCITQLKAQEPSGNCNESKEEEEEDASRRRRETFGRFSI